MTIWELVDQAIENFSLAFLEKLKNSLNSTTGNKFVDSYTTLFEKKIVFIIHICYNVDAYNTYKLTSSKMFIVLHYLNMYALFFVKTNNISTHKYKRWQSASKEL